MKKNSILVKKVLMSIATAATFTFGLTACSDDNLDANEAGDNIPEYAAKYVDANNIIHPAAILLTDAYGYDKDVHYSDDQPSAAQTRAAQTGEYQYLTSRTTTSTGTSREDTFARLFVTFRVARR